MTTITIRKALYDLLNEIKDDIQHQTYLYSGTSFTTINPQDIEAAQRFVDILLLVLRGDND